MLNHTNLAHIVEHQLGTDERVTPYLYYVPNWKGWENMTTIHLLIRHQPNLFNETNIWYFDRAYGRMCRGILKKANLFLPSDNNYLKD